MACALENKKVPTRIADRDLWINGICCFLLILLLAKIARILSETPFIGMASDKRP
jgi:hypothetical protein